MGNFILRQIQFLLEKMNQLSTSWRCEEEQENESDESPDVSLPPLPYLCLSLTP